MFLGFGFLPDNMRLLNPSEETEISRVYATAYGLSDDDRDVIKRQVYKLINPGQTEKLVGTVLNGIEVRDFNCRELFKEFGRSLQPI